MKPAVTFTRVFDILEYQQARYAQVAAINTFKNNNWYAVSISGLINRINGISGYFMSKGFKNGDAIIIIPEMGSFEWVAIDFACQQLGIIVVPIHPTLSVSEANIILAEIKPVLIISNHEQIPDFIQQTENDQWSILNLHNPLDYSNLFEYQVTNDSLAEINRIKSSINAEDILTIMYTSGSTGEPKGAVLSHRNMVSNILFSLAAFPLEASSKVMSFLPLSHIFERSVIYAYIACGASIHFVRNRSTFLPDFQSAEPYFTTAVPRVLEKMYAYLEEAERGQHWLKRKLTIWSLAVAKEFNKTGKKRITVSIRLFFARLFVLNRWKNRLGGSLKCIVVGAASLDPEIARMFSAAGIRIREGYGMTEASPLISLNRFSPGLNRFGTVGIPIPAVKLKIIDPNSDGEGEIWIKGPNVTRGYYNRPALNKEAFTDDGWFKTGDVGKFSDKKFLQITDRKKDIFKTSAGKYIAPQQLENLLKSSAYVSQCMVIGFARPFVTALIVPDVNLLEEWCRKMGIHWTSPQYMIHNIKVIEKIKNELDSINEKLLNYQKIRGFVLNHEEWTSENKLLTPSQKARRKLLLQANEKAIEKLYQ